MTVRTDRPESEGGFVLATCALLFPLLLAMAGFVIDLGNWYLVAEREQRAVDAAALAGATFLPRDSVKAVATAMDVLVQNQMDTSGAVAHPVSDHPGQLYVSVEQTVPTYFVRLFGIDSVLIKREATGAYKAHLKMGSPSNVLGTEPVVTGYPWQNYEYDDLQDNFWLTIFGGATSKIDGARWSGGGCDGWILPDNCDSSAAIPNTEYATNGQKYILHVPKGISGKVVIEVFDASYVNTGLHCTQNMDSASEINPFLYAIGDSPYCAGDTSSSGGETTTTYAVYNDESHPTAPGALLASCKRTFQPFVGDIGEEILSNPSGDTAKSFHRWSRICTFDTYASNPARDYILRVTTPETGRGENQFSLRAGVLGGGGSVNFSQSAKLSIYSESRLEIVTTSSDRKVSFFLTELSSTLAGQAFKTEMFSLGDDSPTDVRIVPPSTSTVDGVPISEFTECTRIQPRSTTPLAAPDCIYPKASAWNSLGETGFTGSVGSITVQIPAKFECDSSVPGGCWVRVELLYDNDSTIQDTTSWTTTTTGSLVKLVT